VGSPSPQSTHPKKIDVSSQFFTMTCTNDGCPARVHGYVPKYVVNWVARDIMPHTCVIPNLLLDRRNLTLALVQRDSGEESDGLSEIQSGPNLSTQFRMTILGGINRG
jgi:hypothetical protein